MIYLNLSNFLIRKERLHKNWSQEGLCKGICTVSYLSKIEQGKVTPSSEIIILLFQKLGIQWNEKKDKQDQNFIELLYEFIFSYHKDEAIHELQKNDWKSFEYSNWGIDYLLIEALLQDGKPLYEALEACMDKRQLAIQRYLQKRYEEAIALYPNVFFIYRYGVAESKKGHIFNAIEQLKEAYQLASNKGFVYIMFYAQIYIGNCYCNIQNYDYMMHHYMIAKMIGKDLKNVDCDLEAIEYNIASTQVEMKKYEDAIVYFQNHHLNSVLHYHKLAICYEALGYKKEALETLENMKKDTNIPNEELALKMCKLIEFRLKNKDYLDRKEYYHKLIECFQQCYEHLPIGFCLFHLPWLLEWYEYHRQYKIAYDLLNYFPNYRKK